MPKYIESAYSKVRTQTRGVSASWWKAKPGTKHEEIFSLMKILRDEQYMRDKLNKIFLEMYLGHEIGGLWGGNYEVAQYQSGVTIVNAARSAVSAANAKISSNKARVLYLTEGGNWSQQARAKRMTKAINGVLYNSNFYSVNSAAQLDSCVFDLGCLMPYREGSKIMFERVPGCEIRVDPIDARYGTPTQLHRECTKPRAWLLERYPQHKKIIEQAPISDRVRRNNSRWVSDCVDVIYSWKMKSGEGADDGERAVSISTGLLEEGKYLWPRYPLVFHRWELVPLGFYSQSICSELYGTQYAINRTANSIQDHADLSSGFVAVDGNSDVDLDMLMNNEVWREVRYVGTPPAYVVPPAFQVEKVDWLGWLVSRSYEETGISQLFASARKPSGVNSGRALRELSDQNTERLQSVDQRFEASHVVAAQLVSLLLEEAYEEDKSLSIKTEVGSYIAKIEWDKARLDHDNYIVKAMPTGFLPSTPSAKLATVEEMMEAGLIGRSEGLALLDYPDLERLNQFENAPYLNIHYKIEKMLDADTPQAQHIEPFMAPHYDLAMRVAAMAYNDAQANGAPEENLGLLRDFMAEIDMKKQQQVLAAQPQAPVSPEQGGEPLAPPVPGGAAGITQV